MHAFRFALPLLCLVAAACALPARPVAPVSDPGAEIRLYLQPLPQETHRLTFAVEEIAALPLEGSAAPLRREALVLRADDFMGEQRKIASAPLPPGVYRGLALTVGSATLLTEEGETRLLVPEEALVIEEEFTVTAEGTQALFLSLAADRIVAEGYRFTPKFVLSGPRLALPGLKGFVTSTARGTLTVFEKVTPAVTNVLALGRAPGEIVLDQSRRWAFVPLAADDAIATVDVVNEAVQAEIPLRPGDEPVELALSADGRTLVSANAGSNSVSVIDALSLFERERLLLSSRPSSVFFSPRGDRAFALQEETSTLSVIDTRRPVVAASTRLEEPPVRGAASPDGRALYLATTYSSDLLVVDAATLAVTGRKFVGPGAAAIVVDENDGLIYVGLSSGGIVVLDPALDLPIDTFATSGGVSYLTIDRDENALFALVPERRRVEKYDLVSKQLLGAVEADEGAYAVAIMGEE